MRKNFDNPKITFHGPVTRKALGLEPEPMKPRVVEKPSEKEAEQVQRPPEPECEGKRVIGGSGAVPNGVDAFGNPLRYEEKEPIGPGEIDVYAIKEKLERGLL